MREYVQRETREDEEERKLASQIENRRQPERMRVVIIRAPVKSSPFIPGSFTLRILLHLSFSRRRVVAPSLSRFFTTREILALCVVEHLGAFLGCRKEANGAYSSTLTSLVA